MGPDLELKAVSSVFGGNTVAKVEFRLSITALDFTFSKVEIVTNKMKKARTRR